MDLGLAKKQVVVTGGSKGIGLSIARIFLEEGAFVTITGRSRENLNKAAETLTKHSNALTLIQGDLSKDSGREDLFAQCSNADILVNNAGSIKGGGITDLTLQDWREGWNLKVFGYIHLCKLFLGPMYARKSGVIINIIGMGGRHTRPSYICGAGGNAALIGFTQALGAETVDNNVRVFGINPSATLTDRMIGMFKTRAQSEYGDSDLWEKYLDASNFPFGRMQDPSEIGHLAVMLASPKVQYVSGTVIDSSGGSQWK
jgi:3-oxoacyl-[acyl-carrier protein] reductase